MPKFAHHELARKNDKHRANVIVAKDQPHMPKWYQGELRIGSEDLGKTVPEEIAPKTTRSSGIIPSESGEMAEWLKAAVC